MSSRVTESENLILESARTEIEKHGVLGLRVAEVAARAHCSITQIDRRFED
jgi:AcrR family transcriptional regulator